MASTSEWLLEDKRLLARADDAFEIARRRHTPHFLGFLDERQAALVRAHLPKSATSACFYGGHNEAERVMLGVFPDGEEPVTDWFPLTAVAFSYGIRCEISHRDVLGSLLGCGIAREKVGDILCAEEYAVVFLHEDIAAFVADTVTKIGRIGVTTTYPYEGELPIFHRFEPLTGTVASTRLDSILKVLLSVSRERACDLIREAAVQVDHQPALSPSRTVCEGQILSVKGHGRFVVDDVSQTTKKGRLIVQARRYV
ncbi:MAG: RNA-binding protein [Ruminococcaceae bacterium]|nr:RNA-binding protein [Oscillospiraceae bacterium]